MKVIDLLKEEDSHALFRQARKLAAPRPTITITGSFLDTNCNADPYCRHCIWRARERFSTHFRRRISKSEFVERGVTARAAGIDWLYPVSGCIGPGLPEHFYECLGALRRVSDIKLFGLFTPLNRQSLESLQIAGVDGYRCAIESPNREVFKKVRPSDDYDARIQSIKDAKRLGLKVWSGFIIGLGEGIDDIARGIETLQGLEVDAVLISAFRPTPFTEMEMDNPPNPLLVAKAMAACRILMPHIDLIFAHNNEHWGLTAGCNAGMMFADSRMISELKKMRKAIYSYRE